MVSDFRIYPTDCLSFDPYDGVMYNNTPLREYPTAILFDILDTFELVGNEEAANIVKRVIEDRAPIDKEVYYG